MKQCAFTIVAKNYIGLGQILGQSLRAHNPEVDFFICVADEFDVPPTQLPSEVIIIKNVITDISASQWCDMAFKYDLTEFCTALKPFCFSYFFNKQYEKVYYFDPDIYVFSPINDIICSLDNHTVTLTPQIAGIHVHYTGEHPEWAMNVNGIFNLGFCGIRNNAQGQQVVRWWQERLRDHAFTDRSVGEFTDQKWMDWIPGFLGDQCFIQQSLGMNLAPWNYFEREVYTDSNGVWYVRFRTSDQSERTDRLVFSHFAGYDYNSLKKGIIARKRIEDLREYEDISVLSAIYRDAIVANAKVFDAFISQSYSYATFDDGTPIAAFHRRLYHGVSTDYPSPFATGPATFFNALRRRGMIIAERIDHASRRNVSNMGGKQRMLSIFYKGLYKTMGYKRYVMFLKSLYFYCRPEWHGFLIGKK